MAQVAYGTPYVQSQQISDFFRLDRYIVIGSAARNSFKISSMLANCENYANSGQINTGETFPWELKIAKMCIYGIRVELKINWKT